MDIKDLAKRFNKESVSKMSLAEFTSKYSVDEKGKKTTRFGNLEALYYEITGNKKPDVKEKQSKGE